MEHIQPTALDATMAQLMVGRDTRFYRGSLGKLTAIILLVLVTSATNGYDGSM